MTAVTRPRSSNFTSSSRASSTSLRAMPSTAGLTVTEYSSPRCSEVQARAAVDAFGRHGVDVTLAQDDVFLPLDLHLEAVFGVEQHLVAHFDGPHMRSDRHRLGPGESLGHLGGGRDQDPGPGARFPFP